MADMRENPYVGPRTFDRQEADRFFGREPEADELRALVVTERLVLFYAQSGAGKSSLINTRLIPQLQQAGYAVLPVGRVSGQLPEGIEQVDNMFTFNLLRSLDQAETAATTFSRMSLSRFLAHLASDDGDHYYYDPMSLPAEAPTDDYDQPRYVLVIDQFEELLTTHLERWPEREAFFQQLNRAMLDDTQLWVVLTLREDYLAALEPYAPLLRDKMRARYYMQRMAYPAALEAIRRPAALAGRPFTAGAAQTLADNLRQLKGGRALGQFVEPVQLQVVCFHLWENLKDSPAAEITAQDLAEQGDVDTTLTGFYEFGLKQTAQQTGLTERRLRAWFSTRLITPARTRGLVYRDEQTNETGGLPNHVVDSLTNAYLIRADLRGGETWYELTHDRLVEPILEANLRWQATYHNPVAAAFQAWQESCRSRDRLLRGEALAAAQHFAEAQPTELTADEQRFLADSQQQAGLEQEQARQTARRRNVIIVAAVVVAAAMGLLAVWGWGQATLATLSAEQANNSAATAQANEAEAQAQKATAEAALGMAAAAQTEAEASAATAVANEEAAQVNAKAAAAARLEAEFQARIGRARELAARARLENDVTGQLNLMLAREAVLATWLTDTSVITQPFVTLEADDALRFAVDNASVRPEIFPRRRHTDQVTSVAFSPDGRQIVSGSDDQTLRLWDVATGEEVRQLSGHTDQVTSMAFSPDGRQIVSGNGDQTLRLWDVATGEEVRQLSGHTGWVTSVAFSPDGRQIVSGSDDQTVRLWAAASGEELRQLSGHTDQVTSVAFSPDGRQIVSGSYDQTLRVWIAAIAGLLARSEQLLQRDPPLFTPEELARFGFEGRGRAH